MIQEIQNMVKAIRDWANGKFQKKGNYALTDNAGYSLGLNIDSDYIMTIELKNESGTVLSSKSIDFPIESMVVNADYADGELTLTLQNGNTLTVDISSIVSGLVKDTFTIAGIDMKDAITKEELVTALGINNKVDKVDGKGLSTNDYTTEDKNKLSGIASGAEVNVQSDWNATDSASDDFIKNKPTSMKNPNALTFTGGATGTYDGSAAKSVTIPTALPASDVYSWAKEPTKPSYSKSEVGLGNVPDVATNDQAPTFTQATTRENIASGDKMSVLFGKVKKWFADLKEVAFTGSYNDLSDQPDIPAAVRVKGNAESSYRTGDVNITPANIGLGNVNNTSDVNKPVSTAQQTALNDKVSKSGDIMSGLLKAHGGISLNNSTQQQTPEFILGIKSFADGGNIIWELIENITVGKAYKANGLTGILPVENGGTGKSTGAEAITSLLDSLAAGTAAPVDTDIYLASGVGSTSNYCRRPMSYLWSYIKSKWDAEYKAKTYLSRGNFTSNIDALYTAGCYWLPANQYSGTVPSGYSTATYAYLIVDTASGGGSCIHRYIPHIGDGVMGKAYERMRVNNVWSAWREADTKYTNFVKSGTGAKAGLVPAPPTTAGTSKYLREDGTWQTPPDTNTTYSPSSTTPKPNGTASAGTESGYARGDHVHPASQSTINITDETEGVKLNGHKILHTDGKYSNNPYPTVLNGYNGLEIKTETYAFVRPKTTNSLTLGQSGSRWKEIWCNTSLNTSSDRNLKKNISDLSDDDRYMKFFMLLQPKSYLFKDGESGRTHVGFISQDVEDAMAECGLSSLEFAGFCKDIKTEDGEQVFDKDGNPVYEYSLRYEEFIALNTMVIQKQQAKIYKMEERLDKIERTINEKTQNPTL